MCAPLHCVLLRLNKLTTNKQQLQAIRDITDKQDNYTGAGQQTCLSDMMRRVFQRYVATLGCTYGRLIIPRNMLVVEWCPCDTSVSEIGACVGGLHPLTQDS